MLTSLYVKPPALRGHYTEHVLPGCGHSPHLEFPAEFESAVTAFLAAHR